MNFNKSSQQAHCNINQVPSHEQLKKAIEKRASQKQEILNHLKQYGSISTLEAHNMQILAPAARILELRKQGYDIVKTQDYENYNGMATYFIINGEVSNDK